jgi:hypothetical protein
MNRLIFQSGTGALFQGVKNDNKIDKNIDIDIKIKEAQINKLQYEIKNLKSKIETFSPDIKTYCIAYCTQDIDGKFITRCMFVSHWDFDAVVEFAKLNFEQDDEHYSVRQITEVSTI